jgi:hypothetical protein
MSVRYKLLITSSHQRSVSPSQILQWTPNLETVTHRATLRRIFEKKMHQSWSPNAVKPMETLSSKVQIDVTTVEYFSPVLSPDRLLRSNYLPISSVA